MISSSAVVVSVVISVLSALACLRWTSRALEEWHFTRRIGDRRVTNGAGLGLALSAGLTLIAAQLLSIERLAGRFAWLHLLGIGLVAGVGLVCQLLGARDSEGLTLKLRRPATRAERLCQCVKVAGCIGAIALTVHLLHPDSRLLGLVLNTAFVVLCVHVFARINECPGRVVKFYVLLSLALLLVVDTGTAVRVAPLFIATLVFAPFDMSGRVLIGEVGALVLGTSVGLVMLDGAPCVGFRAFVAVVLVVFSVLAHGRSVSSMIDRVPGLKLLDRLGVTDSPGEPEPR
jgi:hypothetical protein